MRSTLATVVLGFPYIVALLLFTMFSGSGDPQLDRANGLVWGGYLASLTVGYAISTFVLLDRDMKRANIVRDFVSTFLPYVTVLGLVQAEPRFRQAFDVLWASRTEDFMIFQVLGLIYVPCFISFATIQMMMDPELGHVEVNLPSLRWAA